jgi:putative ABC transport system permease protein
VLGSSTQGIVVLLSKDLFETCAAGHNHCNACWILCNEYLASKFRLSNTDPLWIFVLAAAVTTGIAVLTVSLKAVKAALANPAQSLRSE